jgi:hypothetical protein
MDQVKVLEDQLDFLVKDQENSMRFEKKFFVEVTNSMVDVSLSLMRYDVDKNKIRQILERQLEILIDGQEVYVISNGKTNLCIVSAIVRIVRALNMLDNTK